MGACPPGRRAVGEQAERFEARYRFQPGREVSERQCHFRRVGGFPRGPVQPADPGRDGILSHVLLDRLDIPSAPQGASVRPVRGCLAGDLERLADCREGQRPRRPLAGELVGQVAMRGFLCPRSCRLMAGADRAERRPRTQLFPYPSAIVSLKAHRTETNSRCLRAPTAGMAQPKARRAGRPEPCHGDVYPVEVHAICARDRLASSDGRTRCCSDGITRHNSGVAPDYHRPLGPADFFTAACKQLRPLPFVSSIHRRA